VLVRRKLRRLCGASRYNLPTKKESRIGKGLLVQLVQRHVKKKNPDQAPSLELVRQYARQVTRTAPENPKKKYFDYFVFNIIDCDANCGLLRSEARRHTLTQTIGNARGLDIKTRPEVRKLILKTYDFIDISNATIPPALGGSTIISPPIVIVILRQQLDCIIVDYVAPTTPHPTKAKFSSSRIDYYLISSHLTLGGSAMNNHLAYHLLQKIVKALVAGVPCRILDNLVYSRMKLD
jgi:hypothetical protein